MLLSYNEPDKTGSIVSSGAGMIVADGHEEVHSDAA
jgi:hypothetical protein